MQLQVQILNVAVVSKTSKAGKPFQNAEVAFKNLGDGKVGSKNITQYSKVFKTAADAQSGQVYDVVSEKNGEYWEWVSMERNVNGPTPTSEAVATPTAARTQTSPKSTYETAEERARRQTLIVRQSSLTAAIAILGAGAKAPLDASKVKEVAQDLTDWVFQTSSGGIDDLLKLPNDIEVE